MDEVERRHARYYLALAEEASRALRGREQARSIGLGMARAADDRSMIARTLCHLAEVAELEEDYARAEVLLAESLAAALGTGDALLAAQALRGLGRTAWARGKTEGAITRWQESVAAARDAGDTRQIATALADLGNALLVRGNGLIARGLHAESVALYRKLDDQPGIAAWLEGLAAVSAQQGRIIYAARLWGAAEALRLSISVPLTPVERTAHHRHVVAARTQVEDAAFISAWEAGQALTMDEVVAYALEEGGATS